MSADLLREAAEVLRERAEAATTGPWIADVRDNGLAWIDMPGVDGHALGLHGFPDNADYIATMHPGVGLALADWLDEEAAAIDDWDPETGDLIQYLSQAAVMNVSRLILGRAS